jgi:hypothetical protein
MALAGGDAEAMPRNCHSANQAAFSADRRVRFLTVDAVLISFTPMSAAVFFSSARLLMKGKAAGLRQDAEIRKILLIMMGLCDRGVMLGNGLAWPTRPRHRPSGAQIRICDSDGQFNN